MLENWFHFAHKSCLSNENTMHHCSNGAFELSVQYFICSCAAANRHVLLRAAHLDIRLENFENRRLQSSWSGLVMK